MKLFKLALKCAIFSLVLTSLMPAMAAENTSNPLDTYQSSFENYRPLADERLADWKTINSPSKDSNHAGHSMPSMRHEMNNMAPLKEGDIKKVMPSMDSSQENNMKSMNHSHKHDDMTIPSKSIDHHDMKPMSDNKDASMQDMHHSDMTKMEHHQSEQHDGQAKGGKHEYK